MRNELHHPCETQPNLQERHIAIVVNMTSGGVSKKKLGKLVDTWS